MKGALLVLLLYLMGSNDAHYSLLRARFSFDAPGDWREVRRLDGDSVGFVAFAVPVPSADPTRAAANVIVDVALSHRGWDLKKYSDLKLAHLVSGPGNTSIVDDKFWSAEKTRTVLSRGSLNGVPYAVWDKFAVRDSVYLDVRTAVPVALAADSAWEERYTAQLRSFMLSFRVGPELVFPPTNAEGRQ